MSNSGATSATVDNSNPSTQMAEIELNPSNALNDTATPKSENRIKNSAEMDDSSRQLLNNENCIALADIKTTRDLDIKSVCKILRKYTGDNSLEIVSMGPLEDMSGMNDAFNSSICSLSCIATFNRDKASPIAIPLQETDSAGSNIVQKEFNFVVKCPPTSKFIQFAHKFTKPFCNEVSWYIDLVKQLQLTQPSGAEPVLGDTLPECYHAISSYHTLEVNGEGDGGLSKCWYVILIIRK